MRILVVDDDKLVAISLKTILEADENIEVVAIGENGEEAIELYEKHKPDILLMDIRMAQMSGLEAGEVILKKYENAKILYLTTFVDDEYIVKALSIGARGYILKQDFEGIVPALMAVYGGQNVYGSGIIEKLPSLLNKSVCVDYSEYDISPKEEEIMAEVAAGYSNKEIAARLFLGEGTVRNYISTILEKLDLRDRTQLAIFFLKNQK